MIKTDFPVLQVALDQTDPDVALKIAGDAVRGGADWIEAGTPLIKSVGMSAVKRAKEESPHTMIVAEMKPMDAGGLELELAYKAGADAAIITGLAPLSTIEECVRAAGIFKRKVILDTHGMQEILGKEKAQSLIRDIQQRNKEFLIPLPKDSKVVTSLEIKREGVGIVRRLKELFPDKCIIADLKAISNADKELFMAFEAGADVACVVAAAGLHEIGKAAVIAHETHHRVMADLIGIRDHLGEEALMGLAKEIAETGADFLCYHVPIDDQVKGMCVPPGSVKKITNELPVPVAVAGGINRNSASHIVEAGAKIVIVGGAITKAKKADESARQIKRAMALSSQFPVFQMALDIPDLNEAIQITKKAAPYIDWLEVGSILTTSSGLEAVKQLRALFPDKIIVNDLKVVDFGADEVELAAAAGADIIGLWGAARTSTILMAIKKAKELGIRVMIDIGQDEPLEKAKERAKELEAMGADYVVYLIPKDEQTMGKGISPPAVSALSSVLKIPLAVAGGLDASTAARVIEAGAKILIIGGAIYKSKDPGEVAKKISEEIKKSKVIPMTTSRPAASEIIIETVEILARHMRDVAHSLDEKKTQQFLKLLASGSRVIITGMGRSRIAGRYSKNWLSKLGLDVRVIETGDEDVPSDFSLKSGDLLIPISASGKTPSVVDYCATLRKKGKGIIKVLAITAKPDGPAWHKNDLILAMSGRTKEDWAKEKEEKIGRRVPLGTLSEFAGIVFLMAATQAIMEGKFTLTKVKEVILAIVRDMEEALPSIESQGIAFEGVVEAILNTKWKGSRVVLDGFGRLERIISMFASRLIQVYGLNPMILRGDVTAKIRDLDIVIVCSLSGEVRQVYKTVNHCIKERGITPIYFTGFGDSPAYRLITEGKVTHKEATLAEGKVLGIFVPGTVARRGKIVSFSERQFVEGGKRVMPLDNSAEVVLLAIFEGIFACILEKLGLKEEHLEHAELE